MNQAISDILAPQTAKTTFEENEDLFRSIVLSAKDHAIFMMDVEGRVQTWNEGAYRIKGYRTEEIIGRHFSQFYPSEEVKLGTPERELSIALEHGTSEKESWRVRKDGSRFWANVIITALWNSEGKHVGFSEISRDLTERKLSEERLRQSYDLFRIQMESIKDYAIFTLDSRGYIKTWNAGAQRLKGYRADQIIGQHFSRFYPEDVVQLGKPQHELKIATESGKFEEDAWRIRQDGSKFWANVVLTPMRNDKGELLGFSEVTRDLTERVRSEEQARQFFTLSMELHCIAGYDGYFKRLNPAWEKTLGYTEAELLASPFREFIHPDDLANTEKEMERLLRNCPSGRLENRYRCKDGDYRWLMWKFAVSGDSELIYISATDITDRKQIEQEIGDLNVTLHQQNHRLVSSNKELEAFSYSVSHDLRAPLRSIDGFSQALLEDYADKLDEEGKDHLKRVRAASQRMGQLIDDLLTLSRVTRDEMNRENVNLSEIAREVSEECRAADGKRSAEFVIADGLIAHADARLLRIVLTNLIGNAWKFSSRRDHTRIEFGGQMIEGSMEYFVLDNGVGFDMTYISKLFGAFQRLHAATDFPGTGIGLATVSRIINRHGGRIRARSELGIGTTFLFTL